MTGDQDRSGWPDVPGHELHEVLGRGGSATVYRATQTSIDRPVAVKVHAIALEPGAERRFRDEVRAVGALADHPHVVAPIDAGTTAAGAPFTSMELVPAGSLGDRIRAFGPMSPTEVARVGAEVADALEAAHERGIVHGHITPDNILVGRRGRVLLADFGSAALRQAGGAGDGAPPTPTGDVLALGATLHALAAGGAAPAPGAEPAPLPPEVPFALVDLIGSCLAEDPADRPALTELATTLEAIAASAPVAPPTSVAEDDTADDRPSASPDDASTPSLGSAGGTSGAAVAPRSRPATDEGASAGPAAARSGAPASPVANPRRRPLSPPERRMLLAAVLIALSMVAAIVLTLVLGSSDDEDGSGPPVGLVVDRIPA